MGVDGWIGVVLLLAAVPILVLATAAEAGLISGSRARVRALADKGMARAEALHGHLQEQRTLLGALAIARSLAVVLGTALGIFLVLRETGHTWMALAATMAGALVIITVLEAVPRFLVSQSPARWGLRLSPCMRVFRAVFGAPAWALDLPGRALMRLQAFRGRPGERSDEEDEDDLAWLMDREQANGPIEEDERQMIRGVLEMVDTTAHEIMVPRIDIAAVDTENSMEEVLGLIVERGFSRIPLYEETIDNVVGIIYAKDLIKYLAEGRRPESLKEIGRPPYFIPESKRVDELLAEMRQHKVHIAIVVDEYGGTAGLVTIEDLLEEIVGEIEDEYDREEVTIERVTDSEAIVDARVSIDAFNELFGVEVTGEDFDTVGGFVYHHLGKVPSAGDEVHADGLTLRVLSVLGRRIKKVRVTKEPEAGDESAAPSEG
ncbi:MAG: hemolysin family protein [Candidatus Bathyarchaeota archaeon]|nr:hemolysin family protein [Candidatus Bathyarchaeota archaeon]